jgi:hypothetical protein
MLVKVEGFIGDAKRDCLLFLFCFLCFPELPESVQFSIFTVFVPEITFLGSFGKFRKATIIVIMSVCPSTSMEQLSCHWTAFHEI